MPPTINIIAPVLSDQERLQKWEEINRLINEVWNTILDEQKLCIIRNYNTDKEGQQKIDKEDERRKV